MHYICLNCEDFAVQLMHILHVLVWCVWQDWDIKLWQYSNFYFTIQPTKSKIYQAPNRTVVQYVKRTALYNGSLNRVRTCSCQRQALMKFKRRELFIFAKIKQYACKFIMHFMKLQKQSVIDDKVSIPHDALSTTAHRSEMSITLQHSKPWITNLMCLKLVCTHCWWVVLTGRWCGNMSS